MAIEGYIGKPGSGKSYTLTAIVLQHARRGRDVFTNYPVAYDNVYLFGPDDLLDLTPGLIVIDEAHLWFPARQSLRLPQTWLAEMSQTRKNGWDLLWAAQHEKRVDTVIRDISTWMWMCGAWLPWDGHPMLFTAQSWEPEYFRNMKKREVRKVRRFRRDVAEAYETFAKLEVAQHTIQKHDPYAKRGRVSA